MWLALLQHSPEDTAIGMGRTPDKAAEALVRAYPPASGKEVSVVQLAEDEGLGSIPDDCPTVVAYAVR